MIFTPRITFDYKIKKGMVDYILSYPNGNLVKDIITIDTDYIFEKGVTYFIKTFNDMFVNEFLPFNDALYFTDLNSINKVGIFFIKIKEGYDKISEKMFSQFCIYSITDAISGETWSKDKRPWENTLTKLKGNRYYIVGVSKVIGVALRDGQEFEGVELVSPFNFGIQGIVLKSDDKLHNISFNSDNALDELRFYPIESYDINPFNLITARIKIDNYEVKITYSKDYDNRPFTITSNNKLYFGVFNTSGIIDVYDGKSFISNYELIFKPISNNKDYEKLSMFSYVGNRLLHIRFDKNYIGHEFFIRFCDKYFKGVFKNVLFVDNNKTLKEVHFE